MVFWITIAYSLIGFLTARAIGQMSAAYLRRRAETEGLDNIAREAMTLVVCNLFIALLSGPLTWGMAIRSFLIRRDQIEAR